MSVHFSSQRLDWKTPKAVYQILDAEFRFDHDPCPPNYIIDGLTSEWGESNYVNPPYGRGLPKFIAKGFKIKGRLKFDEHKNSAPFPSAIVIFKS